MQPSMEWTFTGSPRPTKFGVKKSAGFSDQKSVG